MLAVGESVLSLWKHCAEGLGHLDVVESYAESSMLIQGFRNVSFPVFDGFDME